MKRVLIATPSIEITRSAQCHPIARWSADRESLFYNGRNAIYLRRRALEAERRVLNRQPNAPRDHRDHMKKIIVATVLATLSSTAALAADLVARAPYAKAPAMMAAVGNWSGLYIGAD